MIRKKVGCQHFVHYFFPLMEYYTYKESRKLERKYPLFHILALLLQKEMHSLNYQ